MDARRPWFVAALTLFVVWVVALGVLAVRSSRQPPVRTAHAQATPTPEPGN